MLLSGCGKPQGAEPGAPGHGPGGGAPPAMPVAVLAASTRSVPVLIDAVGRAEGSKEVEVRARVTGLIEQQRYREGDRVKAGAKLFGIERAPFEIALAQARAGQAQEQARLDQARREAKRLAPLAEQRAISQREYDDAASTLSLAEAAAAAARAQVAQAQLNLSYTSVVAPITGVTGRAEKSQGSLVSPTDGLLTRVTQTDPIWVRFSFSEGELARLRSGKAGAVRLLSADGQPVGAPGKLNFEGSTVDPQLGTVQLRAEFPNPDLALLPGQFVRAQVHAGEERAFVVPQAAMTTGERGKAVWVVKDGKALPAPVEVGAWVGDGWAVRKGLTEGDPVIVDNLLKLRPGAPVAPHAASAPANGGAASAPAASAPAASAAAPASAAASTPSR
ncbi:MAG TPA: efflux RND transporter periplasmic adaptor subunit [Burkholderiaceae bacterium]|nr:efflux RND transporter periplasmic adaptor subunit [Burkholderiaceae bacterium]